MVIGINTDVALPPKHFHALYQPYDSKYQSMQGIKDPYGNGGSYFSVG